MTAALPSLDAIQARADAATEGPWDAVVCGGAICQGRVLCEPERHANGVWSAGAVLDVVRDETGSFMIPDAEFIAHARADVPALSAAIRDVLALHTPEWSCGNAAHTNPDVGCPDCAEYCIECGDQSWTCRTYTAVTAHIDTTPKETP